MKINSLQIERASTNGTSDFCKAEIAPLHYNNIDSIYQYFIFRVLPGTLTPSDRVIGSFCSSEKPIVSPSLS